MQELAAAMTQLELRNELMEKTRKGSFTSLAALEVDYDARLALLDQQPSEDMQHLLHQLQMVVLQDLDANEQLHWEVSFLCQRSVPLEENMAMFMRKAGESRNGQSHVSPMPDWSMGGPSDLGP